MGVTVGQYNGARLTGFEPLKAKLAGKNIAFITCAGPSLRGLDPKLLPAGKEDLRVSVAGSIRLWHLHGVEPDIWAVSDEPIVHEYSQFLPDGLPILGFQQAAALLTKHPIKGNHPLYTLETMSHARWYDNPYQVYSRGTVAIGALLTLNLCGISRFYVFGMDCCRTKDVYHYDGRPHPNQQEEGLRHAKEESKGVFVTPLLNRMILKLREALFGGLFAKMEVTVVGGPTLQPAFSDKISYEEFYARLKGRRYN